MTDAELVKAYAQGNNDAFDQLLKKYSDKVFAYIIRTVKNEDVANDIFQDTFVKAILTIKQGRYTENGKFPAWITRIAHTQPQRAFGSHHRRRHHQPSADGRCAQPHQISA